MKLTRVENPSWTGWPMVSRLADLHNEIDRLFDLPFGGVAQRSAGAGVWAPALEVRENADSYVVRADLPGMKKEDINVWLHEGNLTISGERRSEEKQEGTEVCRCERVYGRFERTLSLPAVIEAEKIKAEYHDGVLHVTLPKSDAAKPKQIEVKVK